MPIYRLEKHPGLQTQIRITMSDNI